VKQVRPGRVLLAAVVTLGMLVLTPSPSWACSCAAATTPQHVKAAGTVAAGTVNWTATDGQTRTYQVGFDAVFKGAAATTEKLRTNANEAACGVGDLAIGKRYLFFVEGEHPGAMRISLCGGTTAYDEAVAREVVAVTGPASKPLAAPTAAGQPDNADHTSLIVGLGGLVLLLCLATGVAATRR
jgi:hypothetical protein